MAMKLICHSCMKYIWTKELKTNLQTLFWSSSMSSFIVKYIDAVLKCHQTKITLWNLKDKKRLQHLKTQTSFLLLFVTYRIKCFVSQTCILMTHNFTLPVIEGSLLSWWKVTGQHEWEDTRSYCVKSKPH